MACDCAVRGHIVTPEMLQRRHIIIQSYMGHQKAGSQVGVEVAS